MGFPSGPGRPYRELADAALLRRATRKPAIVTRLPLKPPLNTPKPVPIDPLPVNPRLGSITIQRPPQLEAIPEPKEITLNSGPVRMSAPVDDDDYLSIAMVLPAPEPAAPRARRVVLLLALVAVALLAAWLVRRAAAEPMIDPPVQPVSPALAPSAVPPPPAPPRPHPAPLTRSPSPSPRPAAVSRSKKARRVSSSRSAAPTPAPVRELAFLTVDAVPFATVWIDGTPAGQTPLIRVRVSAGSHEVRVVSGAGEGRTFAVDLAAGADVRRRIRFQDQP